MTFRQRIGRSHTTVVAYLALFLVVAGGGAWAVSVGKNTVGTKQIRNKQVKTKDVAGGAVTNAKLASGAVGSANVIDGAIAGVDIDETTLQLPQVQPLSLRLPAGTTATTLFAGNGLTLTVDCIGGASQPLVSQQDGRSIQEIGYNPSTVHRSGTVTNELVGALTANTQAQLRFWYRRSSDGRVAFADFRYTTLDAQVGTDCEFIGVGIAP